MNSLVSTGSGFHSGATSFGGGLGGVPLGHPGPAQPLAGQLALFSRELVDLLKSHSGCRYVVDTSIFVGLIPGWGGVESRSGRTRISSARFTRRVEENDSIYPVVLVLNRTTLVSVPLKCPSPLSYARWGPF